jgi:hypothetical protein
MPDRFYRFVQLVSVAIGLTALAGCASQPMDPVETTRPITLESVFAGKTIGNGRFSVPVAGVERKLVAHLSGYRSGKEFDVAEDFTFNDGEKDKLTWRFVRTGPNTWSGKREDTVGEAKVVEANGTVRLDYTADVKSGDSVNRLEFSDLIYGLPDGRFVNTAVVRKLGIPIGSIRIDFEKIGK